MAKKCFYMKKFLKMIWRHKIMAIIALLLLVGGGVVWAKSHAPQQPVKYVMGMAAKGTVVATMSGSGQVSSEREVEVKPTNATGKILKVFVKQGQQVKAGDPILSIDATDAIKSVRDAERSVQDAQNGVKTAQLALDKLNKPADSTALLKAQNAINAAQRSLQDLKDGSDPLDVAQAQAQVDVQERKTRVSADGTTPEIVRDAYDQTVVDLRSLTQTLESALQTVDSILGIDEIPTNASYLQYLGVRSSGIMDRAKSQYAGAKASIAALENQTNGLQASTSTKEDIEQAISSIQKAVTNTDELLQTMQSVMDYSVTSVSFSQSTLDGLRNSVNSARSAVTGKISAAADFQRTIDNAQASYEDALASLQSAQTSLEKLQKGASAADLASAEEKVKEAQAAYDDLKKGPDAVDVASAQQTISQRRSTLSGAIDALNQARTNAADYTVKAPIDGIIASIPVAVADDASPSVAVATLVTKLKLATVTLSEVDVVKVKQGQQATLTFDAVPDLTLAGTVAQVDLVGTASQGVVGYGVKIGFTTDDDRIKGGMSVSAAIQTAVSTDVVMVPNAAIQTDASGASYVLTLPNITQAEAQASPTGVVSPTAPERKAVTVGIADETNTEIKSGLSEGDLVVIRTVQPTSSGTPAPSAGFGGLGGALGGNGAFRAVGGATGGGNVRIQTIER
jgi:multidrug efflux pump subunit AcrA (membrane-fusion protein)